MDIHRTEKLLCQKRKKPNNCGTLLSVIERAFGENLSKLEKFMVYTHSMYNIEEGRARSNQYTSKHIETHRYTNRLWIQLSTKNVSRPLPRRYDSIFNRMNWFCFFSARVQAQSVWMNNSIRFAFDCIFVWSLIECVGVPACSANGLAVWKGCSGVTAHHQSIQCWRIGRASICRRWG